MIYYIKVNTMLFSKPTTWQPKTVLQQLIKSPLLFLIISSFSFLLIYYLALPVLKENFMYFLITICLSTNCVWFGGLFIQSLTCFFEIDESKYEELSLLINEHPEIKEYLLKIHQSNRNIKEYDISNIKNHIEEKKSQKNKDDFYINSLGINNLDLKPTSQNNGMEEEKEFNFFQQ